MDREVEADRDFFPAVAVEEQVENGAVARRQARDPHPHVMRPTEAVQPVHLGEEDVRDPAFARRELFAILVAIDRDEALAVVRQREGGEHQGAHAGGEKEPMDLGGGELVLGVDLLAQLGEVRAGAGELLREWSHQHRQVRVVRRLRDVGKLFLGEALVLGEEMGVFATGGEVGERPEPAVGADHPAQAVHQATFGGGVVGVQAGDLGYQAHHGARLGLSDRGIHGVLSRGLARRREAPHQLGVGADAEG